jgi:hypothetical protein
LASVSPLWKNAGMITPDKFNTLQRAFDEVEYNGLHNNIHPPYIKLVGLTILLPPKVHAKR